MNTGEAGDRIEDHGMVVGKGKKNRVRCKYCGKEVPSFNRLRHHLGAVGSDVMACLQVPADIKEHMRNALLEKKKERLLKEVGELYHPDLPLKRNFTAASSEPRCCQLEPTQASTSAEDATLKKTDNGNGCQLNYPTQSEMGMNVVVEPAPMQAVNRNIPASYMTEDVHPVLKQEVKGDSELLAARCIGRFFYEAGTELTGIKLPSFQRMVDAVISCGAGYKAPRYDELRGWILQEEVNAVNARVEDVKSSWGQTGCSILLDGWTDQRGRSLMNFLVDCPQGTIFLRSVDATDAVEDVDELFLLLSRVVEEVGVRNVVQVVSHSTSPYMEAVGKKLVDSYRTIFWTLCADHCINLILDKIGMIDHVKRVLTEAKTITRFIYSHALPLELMKSYIEGRNLVRASKLKSVAAFITLEKMVSERENLMHMFSSPIWNASVWASRTKGKNICELVKNPSFWFAADGVLKITKPLVGVLHQIKRRDRDPMGFLYDSMDRAKEAIKMNLGSEEAKYRPLWDIVDDIWDNYLHNHLHSAGYYLNPSLFYANDFFVDPEVTNGLLFCIVRMVEDQHSQEMIVQQLDAYRAAVGGFSQGMAIAQRTQVPPALWWSLHGGQSPELQRLAIKILSQTCTGGLRYKLRKGLCEQLHVKGNNNLEQQRFHEMEFVRNNLQLWHSPSTEEQTGNTSAEDLNSLDEWIVES